MIYRNGYGPIDRFCAKHPRFGISNLMLYIVIGQVAVFILDLFFRGMLSSYWLPFSRDLILHGQVWRLVTFIFLPSDSGNPFFLLLGCYFYYWIGTMLEREWGTARFTLFYLSGVVLSVLSGMILGIADIYYINLSIFLVIATLYGEMQVLLFFVIPIKMKWMALIDVALILVAVIQNLMYGSWVGALLPLASFVNFKRVQKQAQKQAKATGGYRHKCAVCGITDADDPNMEFRYCSKCDGYYCYCMNHINNHVHIHHD